MKSLRSVNCREDARANQAVAVWLPRESESGRAGKRPIQLRGRELSISGALTRRRSNGLQPDPRFELLRAVLALAVTVGEIGGNVPGQQREFHQLFHHVDDPVVVG